MTWLTIDTPPPAGDHVLVHLPDGEIAVMYWIGDFDEADLPIWSSPATGDHYDGDPPTHWHPLPDPPSESADLAPLAAEIVREAWNHLAHDLTDALARWGWTAEWEPQAHDEDPERRPDRYVAGNIGRDSALVAHWGTMPVSGHPCLEVSACGLAGTLTSVDLVTTPLEEVGGELTRCAFSALLDLIYRGSVCLTAMRPLPTEPRRDVSEDFVGDEERDDPGVPDVGDQQV